MQFNTPSRRQRLMSLSRYFRSSSRIRLRKHKARSKAPTKEVRHVVANGGTESGIHAKIITSVDQQSVTNIRQMFACNEFMGRSFSYRDRIRTDQAALCFLCSHFLRTAFSIWYPAHPEIRPINNPPSTSVG